MFQKIWAPWISWSRRQKRIFFIWLKLVSTVHRLIDSSRNEAILKVEGVGEKQKQWLESMVIDKEGWGRTMD